MPNLAHHPHPILRITYPFTSPFTYLPLTQQSNKPSPIHLSQLFSPSRPYPLSSTESIVFSNSVTPLSLSFSTLPASPEPALGSCRRNELPPPARWRCCRSTAVETSFVRRLRRWIWVSPKPSYSYAASHQSIYHSVAVTPWENNCSTDLYIFKVSRIVRNMTHASKASILRALAAGRFSRNLNKSDICSVRLIRMEKNNNCSMRVEKSKPRGALIVFEGLDRSGKTSQCSKLLSYLEAQGHSAELWRFPDRTTSVGHMISSYLSNKSQLDDHTIHLLFSANRWEKRLLMENKLNDGKTLIVDRYSYSGVAFSAAKGLDLEWCKAPEVGLLAPDVVVYLDILPEKAAERGGYGGERYEQLEFQRKVAQCYKVLEDPTWKIVDACQPFEDIQKQLQEMVLQHIKTCQKGKLLTYLWSS